MTDEFNPKVPAAPENYAGDAPTSPPDRTAEDAGHATEAMDEAATPEAATPESGFADEIKTCVREEARRMLQAFEDKLRWDAGKNAQIDSLHAELQEYRAGIVAKTARPLVNGIIKLHRDMGKLAAYWLEKENTEETERKISKIFLGVQEDVEILLENNGITPYREDGERFNPRRQTLLGKVETDDPEKVQTIAHRVGSGFQQGEEIIQKEQVRVFVPAPAGAAGTTQPAANMENNGERTGEENV